MAGEWLKLEACTPEKSEVLAITARMGWDDADLTVGKLFRIWRWFDQQTTDGNACGVTTALLDRIVGVSGFCEAVHSVGWLCINETGISLPNFERHNGNTAKSRALTAKRVANHKANTKGNAQGNADTVSGALPREEKRREDTSSLRSEVEPASPQRGSRLPTDWQLPDDWAAWAKQTRPELNPNETAQRFADYWHGVAGAKGRKADWLATWRNWVRNEKAPITRHPQAGGESFYQRDQRLKAQEVAKFAPGIAAKAPAGFDFIEGGLNDVTAIESN